jgi:signal transduction histidine kinase
MAPDTTARRRRTGTVRFRVTALAAVAFAVVLALTGVLLVARQRSGLTEQLDEGLEIQAQRLTAAVEAGDLDPGQPFGDDDIVGQVVDGGGEVLAASSALAGLPPLGPPPDGEQDIISIDGVGDDDQTYRMVSRRFASSDGSRGAVHVASPLDDIDEGVAELISSLLLIVPLATAVLAGVVWFLVGRTLRPVEHIRTQVAEIGLTDLDRRVSQPPGTDEIARLASTMNAMLGRLERSARRQQQFVADASHELRTPLTRMRTELEVDTRHPEVADPAATRQSMLDEIDALQRMIDDLLALARSDAGVLGGRAETVDLDDLVLEEARARRTSSIAVDTRGVSGAQVRGQRDELRRVVRNLLDNAIRHAAANVTVELAEADGAATLTVTDDGPGIPRDRHAEVFERFTRLDDARAGGAGRAGLGLAIAHDVVTRHDGTIDVDAAYTGGARLVVKLPVA